MGTLLVVIAAVLFSASIGPGAIDSCGGIDCVVDGITFHESEHGHAGYTTEGATGLPAGGDMDHADYANADKRALLSFERWAPGMPWEVSAGESVLTGELTVYPAPPASA